MELFSFNFLKIVCISINLALLNIHNALLFHYLPITIPLKCYFKGWPEDVAIVTCIKCVETPFQHNCFRLIRWVRQLRFPSLILTKMSLPNTNLCPISYSCHFILFLLFYETDFYKLKVISICSVCLFSGIFLSHLTVHVTSPQERPVYKGSQTTVGGKWGPQGGVEVDELGRPVVWPNCSESLRGTEMESEKEERRRRVVSYLKNSNMSLVQHDTNCRDSPERH